MDIEGILAELSQNRGYFPLEAVEEAVRQRETIAPRLLRSLEEAIAYSREPKGAESSLLPLYAMHMLAQFRDRRAYPLIAELCRAPGTILDDMLGDTITEGLPRILATVFDGDLAPMRSVVENESGNEWARGAAIRAIGVLVRQGVLARADAIAYFGELFRGRLEKRPSHVWAALAAEAADMQATPLGNEIREAHDEGLIDSWDLGIGEIETMLAKGDDAASDLSGRYDDRPIDDTVAEMRWWACFGPESRAVARRKAAASSSSERPVLAIPERSEPKVGRNKPCPCGSGRKYKKCCGAG